MERLPYIDAHDIAIDAGVDATWEALLRTRPSTGFVVAESVAPERLSLRGRHPFSRYRLDFEVEPAAAGRARVRALTWAEFPGLHGAIYRALVISSGFHRLAVRHMLRQVRAAAR